MRRVGGTPAWWWTAYYTAAFFVAVLAARGMVDQVGAAEVPCPIVFVEEPVDAWLAAPNDAALGAWKPDGCRLAVLESGKAPRVLVPGFSSVVDPCVSIDGTRVLFAGKPTKGSAWDIHEVKLDGTGQRRLTEKLGDCFEPEYLARGAINAPVYDERVRWIVFTSTASGRADGLGGGVPSLWVRSLEPVPGRGIVTWRTTWNLWSDFSPTVLADGRVLFSSHQAFEGHAAPAGVAALLTVSWSGEDLNLFCGNGLPGFVKSMACETRDRAVLYVESEGATRDLGGALARVWMRRPLRMRELLSSGPGLYRHPHALPDGRILVSHAPVGLRYGLWIFDAAAGKPVSLVHEDPAWSSVDGVPATPRAEPLGRISMVVDSRRTATLACIDVYDSDRASVRALPRGAVKRVRFVEGVPPPAPVPAGTVPAVAPALRLLGEAPVEADGSFLVEIVADTPFTMQLLGEKGDVLATMPSWMGLRPHDERTCMGCHEDKEMSPRNCVPEAIRKAAPTPITAPLESRVRLENLLSNGSASHAK